MKFTLVVLFVALCLFGVGYYPAKSYDPDEGLRSLVYGLGLAFALALPSYHALRWALHRSQRVFLITFGAGFLLRLVALVTLFILYWYFVKKRDFCFALAFVTAYLAFSGVEIFHFKAAQARRRRDEDRGEEGGG